MKVKNIKYIIVFIIFWLTGEFSPLFSYTNVFSFSIKNISNDSVTNIITWTNIKASDSTWKVANQYIEVRYITNHSIVTGWGFSLYTYNRTNIANPMYNGTADNPGGLISVTCSNRFIPLAWLIKENKTIPNPPQENESGDFTTSDWHWVIDRSSSEYTNERDYIVPWNQGGIAWHTAVRQKKPDVAYIFIAGKFKNLFVDTFKTSQLRLEEYINNEAKFLNSFYIYTNEWKDTNPVPNHYTPAWESWGSGFNPAEFGYTNEYHSPPTAIKMTFTSDAAGAWVWYEPGSGCPSGPGYGYDLTGAGKLTFWIKGSNNYNNIISAQIGVSNDSCGLVKNVDGSGDDKFNVTTNWTKHYIPLTNLNLSYVSRGFKIAVTGPGQKVVIYVDDIKYEK